MATLGQLQKKRDELKTKIKRLVKEREESDDPNSIWKCNTAITDAEQRLSAIQAEINELCDELIEENT